MIATVLSYCRKRGWGFALPDDGTNDVFIHRSNLPQERKYLNEGDRISYESGERNGRPLALNIQVIAPADAPSEATAPSGEVRQ